MKPTSLLPILKKFAATAFVAAAIGTPANAQGIVASDNASNYGATANWTTGSNGGTGFGNWTITSVNGGNFIGPASAQGSNSATIDTSGNSFGLRANPGGFVNASRSFAQSGDEFSIELAYKWDNGNRGVNVLAGVVEVFNFNINDTGFTWTGNGSAAQAGWTGNRENGAVIRITFSKTNTGFDYSFSSNQATSLNGQSGSIASATPDGFQIYVGNAGGGGANSDFFFNSLQLLGTPPAPTITSPWSAVAVPGVAFSYQTTVTPADLPTTFSALDLPEGLSIDTVTGLVSGTVNATGYYSSNITATNGSGTGEKTIYFYIGKAADTALNYNEAGWTGGSNLSIGSGFGNWTFASSNGSGAAGTFLGNPANAGIQELPAVSFGLYANPGDSGAFVDAIRELSTPLAVGEALAFDWGMNFDSNTANGSKGFIVLVDGAEAINVFNGDTGNITVNGADTGFTYGTYAMFWEFFQSSENSITVYGEPRNPSEAPFFQTYTANGLITAVKFYASGLAADGENADKRQPYFNNLVIMPALLLPPTITSASSANGTAGDEFFYQTTATPALATTYSASGLPAGLSMNSTSGLISGTPETSGSSSVTINATNSAGDSDPFVLDISIAPPEAPTLASPSGGVTALGIPFVYQIEVSPAGVPTTYSAVSLPDGFSLDTNTGLITGTLSSTGEYTISVNATNEGGTSTLNGTFYVGTAADMAGNYVSGGWVEGSNQSEGIGFGNWTFTSGNGSGAAGAFLGDPYDAGITYMIDPSFGLFANPAGSGAYSTAERNLTSPLAVGDTLGFVWGINWDGGEGNTEGNKGFVIFVDGQEAIVVNNSANSTITVNGVDTGMGYGSFGMVWDFTQVSENSVAVSATQRDGSPTDFSRTISTGGRITGIKFYASGLAEGDQRQPYFNYFIIMPAEQLPPTITSASSANGTAGEEFSYQATATPALATTYEATGLPAGLTMNSTSGLISGIPAGSGNSSVTIVAANLVGESEPFALNISIAPPEAPWISGPWGAITIPGSAFSYQVETNPAGVPTTYRATGLPDGLVLDPQTGLISGNTTSTGISTVILVASNEAGDSEPMVVLIVSGSSADLAYNYLESGWTENSNQSLGAGFGSWFFNSFNGTGAAGAFLGDPSSAGIFDMATTSFGLYANPPDSGASASVIRSLTEPLAVGETLAFQWGINFDAGNPTGTKGFILYAGAERAIRVENGGNSSITLNGVDIEMPYGSSAMSVELTQTSNTTVRVTTTSRDGSGTIFSTDLTTTGPIDSVEFYANGLSAGEFTAERQPYFDSFVLMPPSAPSVTSWPLEGAVVGGDFFYQTRVSPNLPATYNATGLPAGLSINSTTGEISGIPEEDGLFQVAIQAANQYGTGPAFSLFIDVSIPVAPVVTSPWGAVAVPGVPFAYQTTTYPELAGTTFEATGLPFGWSIDGESGLIEGIPAATGYYEVNITAANAGGAGNKTLYISVGLAADTASNYIGGNWTNGSNLSIGTGFGNWTFTSSNGTGGAAGAFLGNPAAAEIQELPAVSFGLFANPEDSGAFIDARRDLSSPLAVGDALEFDWGINVDSDTPNGSKGIVVFAGDEQAVVVYNSDSSVITVNGEDTGFRQGTTAMYWSFTQTSGTSLAVFASPRNLADDSYSANITTNGTITAIKFFATGLVAGSERQPYFNNFVIMPGSGPSPGPYDSWASGYGLDPSQATGPNAGAPAADPDNDSFANQQEYAFGTDPKQPTAGLMTTSSTGGNLTVVFITRNGGELAYSVQTTGNLSTSAFSDNPAVTATVQTSANQSGVPDGYTRKQFTITPSGGRNFYRVVASETPQG